MQKLRRALALAGAAAVAVTVGQPGIAVADDAVTGSIPTASVAVAPSAASENFAGYQTDLGRNKTVKAKLTVPDTGNCDKDKGVVSVAQQFGEDSTRAAVQAFAACAGTDQIVFVRLIASDGTPTDITSGVLPGDKIKVNISEERRNKIVAKNVTQDWKETASGPALDAVTYQVGNGTVLLNDLPIPLPDFGRLKFNSNEVGGKELADADPTKYDCKKGRKTRMETSKIEKGTNFTVKFVNP